MRAALLPLLLLLLACAGEPGPSEADGDVVFGSARADDQGRGLWEVAVRIDNPTDFLSAERYAECIIAGSARDTGGVWVERLRGARRVQGQTEELAVLYRVERIRQPQGEAVFTAALSAKLCEIDGVPTAPQVGDPTRPLPALPGVGPDDIENPTATAIPPAPGAAALPEPEPAPAEDPVDGI
ncbi:MAG: hypothetical protein AAGI50_05530 [Pseudomonadota bacterium]